MTKLMEWVTVATVFLSIWTVLITSSAQSILLLKWRTTILYLPLILIVLFGLYAASVVLYRTLTFNNCEDAAVELQKEIKEAKADLRSKGLKLRED